MNNLKKPSQTLLSVNKQETFPNKSKLSNLLRIPIKSPSTIKNPPQQSASLIKPLKSNSISYSNNNSSIMIFGSNPSIIQINNYLPNKASKSSLFGKKTDKTEKSTMKNSNNEHKKTYTSENILSQEKILVNTPFSARNDTFNKGILDKKASLPNLDKNLNFTINFKALMKMRNNPKFAKYSKKTTTLKPENLEEKTVNVNEMMGGLLKRAQKVLRIYSLKEKQWKLERETLKKQISELKNN